MLQYLIFSIRQSHVFVCSTKETTTKSKRNDINIIWSFKIFKEHIVVLSRLEDERIVRNSKALPFSTLEEIALHHPLSFWSTLYVSFLQISFSHSLGIFLTSPLRWPSIPVFCYPLSSWAAIAIATYTYVFIHVWNVHSPVCQRKYMYACVRLYFWWD